MKVVFLDRDGTLIREPADRCVDSVDKVELVPDAIEALRYLADNDFAVVIVTNQSGIDEGRMTEDDFWRIHATVLDQLSRSGVTILKTYMNPETDNPEVSEWRKPGPKMLVQAIQDFDLDGSTICMIGDRETDVEAAIRAGCKGGVRIDSHYTMNDNRVSEALHMAPHLLDAVRFVVMHNS